MTSPLPIGSPPPPTPSAPSPPGVIFLVDDDDGVRQLARRVLEMRGMTVLAFADPAETLRAFADYPDRVDALVTDVSLPGMNGRELAAAARAGRPDLKVVLMSGYPRDEVFGPGPADPGAEFLPKPFSTAKLADVLARVLAAPAPRPAAGGNNPQPSPAR